MAEVFPQQGLDALLSIIPRSSQPPSILYAGLFTSQSATTVISPTQSMLDIVEPPPSWAYVRATFLATAWGAATFYASGRMVTASVISFPTFEGVIGSINGFFLSPTSTPSTGIVVYQANFDDNTQLPVATYDRVSVQPTIKFGY